MSEKPTQEQITTTLNNLKPWLKKGIYNFVNNQFVPAQSGKTFATLNPANQETLAEVARSDAKDVDLAVTAARKALEGKAWKMMRPTQRAQMIFKLGELIQRHTKELAVLETLDNGKTINESFYSDLPSAADIFFYYSGWATKIHGETIQVPGPYLNYTLREPVGVCGQIIPWNYPLLMLAWKVAPALACGNTVVLKPAEETPLSANRFAELCLEAGLPEGVVNIVHGFGEEAGAAISKHRGIDKVAFTGSTEVGRKILLASSESNLKRVSLELGGKSPQIIFADADIKQAVKNIFYGIFYNKGEVCSAGSRVYVEKPCYQQVVDEVCKMVAGLKIGDPLQLTTGMGALVNKDQVKKVLSYIDKGKSSGAKLAAGGQMLEGGDFAKGNFVSPTVFCDVPDNSPVARDEVFGPVLSMMAFDSEEEVLAKANDTPYGLVASVWTQNISRAHRFARGLQAGTVWVNCYNCFDSASPFGGMKESGFGREMGAHALELYTQVKSVWVNVK